MSKAKTKRAKRPMRAAKLNAQGVRGEEARQERLRSLVSHRHLHDAFEKGCTEVSPDVCLQPYVHGHGEEEHVAGYFYAHEAADRDGYRCESAVNTDPHFPSPCWQATGSLEGGDLTLTPSLLCRRDQFHGFVRDGKWVSA